MGTSSSSQPLAAPAFGTGPAFEAWQEVSAPASVVIPTCDDERILRDCLATCVWSDDVHVVDFGSVDRTREVAAEYGATVHTLSRADLPTPDLPQKRAERAMREFTAKHDWVIHIEANERLTPDLVHAVHQKLAGSPAAGVLGVARRFVFMDRWLKHAAEYPAYEARLFRREYGASGKPRIFGAASAVPEPFIQHGFAKGIADWLTRCNRHSEAEAARIHAGERAPGDPPPTTRSPAWTFLRTYLFGLGCLDGSAGLTYCMMRAYYDYQVALKVRELRLGLAPVPPTPAFPAPEAGTAESARTPEVVVVPQERTPRPRPAAAELPSAPWERFGDLVPPGQRVIITGGSGFMGTNLVEFYYRAGAEVINIDFQPPRNPAHERFWRNINVCSADAYRAVVRDFAPTLFLHLAARTDLDEKKDLRGYSANTAGVENTLRALEGLKSLERIFITSSELVCHPGYAPKSEDDYAPTTMFGRSKVQTEQIVRAWKNAPCPWVLIRPTLIWGPWFQIPYKTFFLSIARRKYVHQRGVSPRRSAGFVYNAVYEYAALARASAEQVDRKTLYVSDAEPIRIREWADMIQREMGARPLREAPMSYLSALAKGGDLLQALGWKDAPLTSFRLRNLTSDNTCDMGPVNRIVGPMPYTIEEGVRITVEWMRREGSLPRPRRSSETLDGPAPAVGVGTTGS